MGDRGVDAEPDPARLRDPATGLDPHPVYDELRPYSPVRLGSRSWLVLDHEQVRAVLGDPVRFSSNVRASDNPVFRDSPLVFDDPPRHTQLRGLINKAFTPRRVASTEPWVRTATVDLLAAAEPGPIELVAALADPLPVLVIATMLGIPVDEHHRFKQWSNDRAYVVYHSRADGPKSPELLAAEAGCQALTDWFVELAAQRRSEPGDDLISALATAEIDGEGLAIEEVAGVCSVLLTAGNLTTTRLLSNLGVAVAGDAALQQQLRDNPETAAVLVEESLRLDSPVQMPIRVTTTDVELGGATIPAGQFVSVGVGAANRDAAVHADPHRRSLDRDQPHLAFGHGIHFCLGAALARLEATTALSVLVERYERLSLAEPPEPEPELAHSGHRRVVVDVG